MHSGKDYHDPGSEVVSWTRDEKARAMSAVMAYENRKLIIQTIKNSILITGTIVGALALIKASIGDWWSSFLASWGPHK